MLGESQQREAARRLGSRNCPLSATMLASPAAGARLRDVILEMLADPRARDALGWLEAASIGDTLLAL